MSFNLNKNGRPICIIIGGRYDGEIVYYSDDEVDLKSGKYINFTHLKIDDGKLSPYPNTSGDRDVLSALGPAGSGKSYIIQAFVKQYQKVYPKNEQYCISIKDDDKTFKDLKKLTRLKLDDKWSQNPLEYKDFGTNTLLIFDDTDTIRNKDIKNSIDELKNQVMECGRDQHQTILITSHLATKGRETKTLLNESNIIVFYLSSGASYKTLLDSYLGLTSKQIQKLKGLQTRWIAVLRSFPMIVYTEFEVFFLKDL